MKNFQISSIFIKTTVVCLAFIFLSTGSGFSQKAGMVAETEQFVLTSEHVSYSYKSRGKKYKSTKFDHYKLTQKATKVELARYTKCKKFGKTERFFEVGKKDQLGILDLQTGKMILPAMYKQLASVEDSIIVATAKTETLFDFNGKKLIDALFTDVQFYMQERVIYDKSDKNQTFYSFSGKLLSSFPNAKLHEFHEREVVLERNGKYGICTIEGKEIVPFEYADAFFGEQYLSLGKTTASGIKYGMFTGSDLKTPVFPFEFDYLRDIGISTYGDGARQGFVIYNKEKNTLKILDADKKEFAEFSHFTDTYQGLETARTFQSLDEIDDYFAVVTTDGAYQIYLHDGQSISYEDEYDYYSTYEDMLPGYVFFHGRNTLILPLKYKDSRQFYLPFEVYEVSKLSDKAFYLSTDYGDNIFRPYHVRPLVNEKEVEVSLTYELDSYKIAVLSDYEGNQMAYDILNDSLIFSRTAKEKRGEEILFDYIVSRVKPLLKVKPFNEEITEINTRLVESGMYRYTNQAGELILEDLPYHLNLQAKNVNNGEGQFITTEIYVEEENAAINMILDSKMNVIKPYTGGALVDIYLFENDTIILSNFSYYSDSSQIYSCHHKKLIYQRQYDNIGGSSYFSPNITRHGIMNYDGYNGLMGYDGKLKVPFKYEFNGGYDSEFSPRTVMEFSSKKQQCYYFTEPGICVYGPGNGYGVEFQTPNTNVYILKMKEGYQIYDVGTAKPVINRFFSNIELVDQERYLIVSTDNNHGLFDIQKMALVEDLKFNSDEIHQLLEEKYLNR